MNEYMMTEVLKATKYFPAHNPTLKYDIWIFIDICRIVSKGSVLKTLEEYAAKIRKNVLLEPLVGLIDSESVKIEEKPSTRTDLEAEDYAIPNLPSNSATSIKKKYAVFKVEKREWFGISLSTNKDTPIILDFGQFYTMP
jgi:hypothetical protein